MTERERAFFELGLNLASRVCRDNDCDDCFDKLITLQVAINALPPDDVLPHLPKSRALLEEVVNEFPQLWVQHA